nr:MAG TPA: hypothetical protein [Caudoviricetes sp.]
MYKYKISFLLTKFFWLLACHYYFKSSTKALSTIMDVAVA